MIQLWDDKNEICLYNFKPLFPISYQHFILQNISPAMLLRFLREHRSEWADINIDAYSAAAVKTSPCALPGSFIGGYGSQVILPLAHTVEFDEVNFFACSLHYDEINLYLLIESWHYALQSNLLCLCLVIMNSSWRFSSWNMLAMVQISWCLETSFSCK